MTVSFNDLKPGISDSITKTVSEQDVVLFGQLSGDLNPLHFDEAFARRTVARHRVVHGGLVFSLVSAVFGTKLPGPGTIVLEIKTAFTGVVRIGDAVTAVCTVREVQTKRRVLFDCICKVGEAVVLKGEALVLAPANP
jgi:3-hydroxybutyryl-CoA dehydratase